MRIFNWLLIALGLTELAGCEYEMNDRPMAQLGERCSKIRHCAEGACVKTYDGHRCFNDDASMRELGQVKIIKIIKIIDTSFDDDTEYGATGADICSVSVVCADTDPTATCIFEKGEGYLCTGSEVGGAKCSDGIDHASVNSWLSDDYACDNDFIAKQSGYISLGMKGVLIVNFSDNINGCQLDIVEATRGKVADSYKVMACFSIDDCVEVIASGSGDKSIDIDL